MAKTKRPLGEVKITRGETDDEALVNGYATWLLEALGASAKVWHHLGSERYEIAAKRSDGGRRSTLMTATDFGAVVAATRALMESVR